VSTGWRPAALNAGHTYRDRLPQDPRICLRVSDFYAARYRHSSQEEWRRRLAAGEIARNGATLHGDAPLAPGDRLAWHRPPWLEPAVPLLPEPLFDDGDLVAFAKPSGLPVLPAGGFLEHTLLRELERRVAAGVLDGRSGVPRPVHRLGRFSSGLLLCARSAGSRAWLSGLLRAGAGAGERCRKQYRALTMPLPAELGLVPGRSVMIATPIGRRPHARLGRLWCAADHDAAALAACSSLTLLERRRDADLVQVEIATGRPHQIRIHTASIGAPLLGDPLYGSGGCARSDALPGDGGYHLHAHRLGLQLQDGQRLELEAPPPPLLRAAADG
jgi:23S rRNA pseudouridine1911/1915/1917 synthase